MRIDLKRVIAMAMSVFMVLGMVLSMIPAAMAIAEGAAIAGNTIKAVSSDPTEGVPEPGTPTVVLSDGEDEVSMPAEQNNSEEEVTLKPDENEEDVSDPVEVEDEPAEEPVKDEPAEEPVKDEPAEEPVKDEPAEEPVKDEPDFNLNPIQDLGDGDIADDAPEITVTGITMDPADGKATADQTVTVTVSFSGEGLTEEACLALITAENVNGGVFSANEEEKTATITFTFGKDTPNAENGTYTIAAGDYSVAVEVDLSIPVTVTGITMDPEDGKATADQTVTVTVSFSGDGLTEEACLALITAENVNGGVFSANEEEKTATVTYTFGKDTPNAENGTYTIAAGEDSVTVEVDLSTLSLTIDYSDDGTVHKDDIEVPFTVEPSDAAVTYQISIDGVAGEVQTASGSPIVVGVPEGTESDNVSVEITATYGTKEKKATLSNLKFDTKAPAVALVGSVNPDKVYNSDLTVRISVDDENATVVYWIEVDGEKGAETEVTSNEITVSVPANTESNAVSVFVRATDEVGNTAEVELLSNLKFDNKIPDITFILPDLETAHLEKGVYYFADSVTIGVSVEESNFNPETTQIRLDATGFDAAEWIMWSNLSEKGFSLSQEGSTYTATYTLTAGMRLNKISVWAKDAARNTATTKYENTKIEVIATAPVIEIDLPQNPNYTDEEGVQYFNTDQIVTITVTGDLPNFKESKVTFTGEGFAKTTYKLSELQTVAGNANARSFTLTDGMHLTKVEVTAKNMLDVPAEPKSVETNIAIYTTVPTIMIDLPQNPNYTDEEGIQYFNTDQIVIITVTGNFPNLEESEVTFTGEGFAKTTYKLSELDAVEGNANAVTFALTDGMHLTKVEVTAENKLGVPADPKSEDTNIIIDEDAPEVYIDLPTMTDGKNGNDAEYQYHDEESGIYYYNQEGHEVVIVITDASPDAANSTATVTVSGETQNLTFEATDDPTVIKATFTLENGMHLTNVTVNAIDLATNPSDPENISDNTQIIIDEDKPVVKIAMPNVEENENYVKPDGEKGDIWYYGEASQETAKTIVITVTDANPDAANSTATVTVSGETKDLTFEATDDPTVIQATFTLENGMYLTNVTVNAVDLATNPSDPENITDNTQIIIDEDKPVVKIAMPNVEGNDNYVEPDKIDIIGEGEEQYSIYYYNKERDVIIEITDANLDVKNTTVSLAIRGTDENGETHTAIENVAWEKLGTVGKTQQDPAEGVNVNTTYTFTYTLKNGMNLEDVTVNAVDLAKNTTDPEAITDDTKIVIDTKAPIVRIAMPNVEGNDNYVMPNNEKNEIFYYNTEDEKIVITVTDANPDLDRTTATVTVSGETQNLTFEETSETVLKATFTLKNGMHLTNVTVVTQDAVGNPEEPETVSDNTQIIIDEDAPEVYIDLPTMTDEKNGNDAEYQYHDEESGIYYYGQASQETAKTVVITITDANPDAENSTATVTVSGETKNLTFEATDDPTVIKATFTLENGMYLTNVTVNAVDLATNPSDPKNITDDTQIIIDMDAPVVTINVPQTDNKHDGVLYFNTDQQVTIEIKDANLDVEKTKVTLQISGKDAEGNAYSSVQIVAWQDLDGTTQDPAEGVNVNTTYTFTYELKNGMRLDGVTVDAFDLANNETNPKDETKLVIDTDAPEVTITMPQNPDNENGGIQYYKTEQQVTIEIKDANLDTASTKVTLAISGKDANGNAFEEIKDVLWKDLDGTTKQDPATGTNVYTHSFTYTLKNGMHLKGVTVNAIDLATNKTDKEDKTQIIIDKDAPIITITMPQNPNNTVNGIQYFNTEQQVRIEIRDANLDEEGTKIHLTISGKDANGTTYTTIPFTKTKTEVAGTNLYSHVYTYTLKNGMRLDGVTVNAIDCATNKADAQNNTRIIIDTDKPVVTITMPQNPDNENGGVQYYKNDQQVTITIRDANLDMTNTTVTLTISGKDANGNAYSSVQNVAWKDLAGTTQQDPAAGSNVYTHTFTYALKDGMHLDGVSVNAVDNATNRTDEQNSTKVVIDTDAPEVMIMMPNVEGNDNYVKPDGEKGGVYYYGQASQETAKTVVITIKDAELDLENTTVTLVISGKDDQGNAYSSIQQIPWKDLKDAKKQDPAAGTNVTTYTFTYALKNGMYLTGVTVNAIDLAKNATNKEDNTKIVVDTVAPKIEIKNVEDQNAYGEDKVVTPVVEIKDTNYSDNSKVELSGFVMENNSIKTQSIEWTSRDPQAAKLNEETTYTYSYDNLTVDGVYTLTVTATDLAGNKTEKKITFSVNRYGSTYYVDDANTLKLLDKYYSDEAPTLVIHEINPNTIEDIKIVLIMTSRTIELKNDVDYTVSPGDGSQQWTHNIYTIKPSAFLENGVLREGEYTVQISSKDGAENENINNQGKFSMQFMLDETKPNVTILGVENDGLYKQNTREVTITFKDLESGLKEVQIFLDGNLEVKLDSEKIEELRKGTYSFNVNGAPDKQKVTVKVADNAGNVKEQEVKDFTVSNNVLVIAGRYVLNNIAWFGAGAGVAALGVGGGIYAAKRKKKAKATAA